MEKIDEKEMCARAEAASRIEKFVDSVCTEALLREGIGKAGPATATEAFAFAMVDQVAKAFVSLELSMKASAKQDGKEIPPDLPLQEVADKLPDLFLHFVEEERETFGKVNPDDPALRAHAREVEARIRKELSDAKD